MDTFIIILVFAVLILLFLWNSMRTKLLAKLKDQEEKSNKTLNDFKYYSIQEVTSLRNELQNQNRAIQSLQKYIVIEDIEKECTRLKIEAESILEMAKAESKTIKANATKILEDSKTQAGFYMDSTVAKAKRIIDEAESKAKEIAGEAFDVSSNLQNLQKSLVAIKNIIDGYGTKYIVPAYTIIDILADETSHFDAGVQLSICRTATKSMVEKNIAASCDYAREDRRQTAIRFVLDSFNSKVDALLTLVKIDNYGTLKQKIIDAYNVVNLNGTAFRDARISEQYLNCRLDELKWAVAAIELKNLEREEQRMIKEQLRDEEKARREFERSIKDAEKEEDTIKKAMERMQNELLKANDDQKIKYEAKLLELTEKLKLAEEKSQRALSMAQQTKSGHVYIISNIGSFGENVYKIGMTRRLEPHDRIRELGDASVPFEFDIHAMIYSDDAPALEHELHKKFITNQVNKINARKEFFKVQLKDIRKLVDEKQITTHWTMTAAAREYYETLALESVMVNNKEVLNEWIQAQEDTEELMEDLNIDLTEG
jgi:hypothetical protein